MEIMEKRLFKMTTKIILILFKAHISIVLLWYKKNSKSNNHSCFQ